MKNEGEIKDQVIVQLTLQNQRLADQVEALSMELLRYKKFFLHLDRLIQTVEHNNLTEFIKQLFKEK